ncbi:MAG: Asp-tRNA(Asn)/Glu-tRNA(Gln) amidotransferase subunit GatC [Candidatus Eisenbacteria bacterium]|nr:Asp-tRNA(Asn)/Glu-tRNA(Gln) amidotransferase subunit GatC [Candidatus Eisenbacteria bacterium]
MTIDASEVRRVAALAKLELAEGSLERVAGELSSVLEFAATLNALDLADCEPAAFAPADAPLRADAPDGRTLGAEDVLAGAPETRDGCFVVPPIVENLNP